MSDFETNSPKKSAWHRSARRQLNLYTTSVIHSQSCGAMFKFSRKNWNNPVTAIMAVGRTQARPENYILSNRTCGFVVSFSQCGKAMAGSGQQNRSPCRSQAL